MAEQKTASFLKFISALSSTPDFASASSTNSGKRLQRRRKMFKLRYYCQGGGNREILGLLQGTKEKYNIVYEIVNLWGQEQERQAYERDFKPRAKILKKRTGKPITKLRGAGGERHYYVSIPGTIAIVRNAEVEWWTHTIDEIKEFLDEVLLQGQAFLEKLCI